MSLRLRLSPSLGLGLGLGLGLNLSPEPHPGQARAASLLQRMQMAGVQMDARSYAVTLSALLKARAEPEALRITRAILDRLEEQEQEQEQEQERGQGQGQEQAWVPWSRRKAEGAAEGAGGRRRPPRKAPLRVDAALCNVMLQVVMRAGEEGEERRVLSRLRAAGLKPSVRTPAHQQPLLPLPLTLPLTLPKPSP